MKKFYHFIFRYKAIVIGLYILSIIFSLYKINSISYDFNIENYFPQNNPVKDKYDEFRKIIENDDDKVIIYVSKNAECPGDVLDKELIDWIDGIEKKLKDLDHFSRMVSINSLKISYVEDTMLNFKTVRELLDMKIDRSVIRKRVLASPIIIDNVISDDLKTTLIVLRLNRKFNDDIGREQMRKSLFELINSEKKGSFEVLISGIPYIRAQYVKLIKAEQGKFMPIALGLLFLLLIIIFGNVLFVVFTFIVIIVSCLWTMCIMSVNGVPITIFTSVIPLILLVIGITDSIHVLCVLRFKKKLLSYEKISEVFSHMYVPCFLTSITTFSGFLGLLMANVKMVNQFAIYTALGVMLSYINTIILLPLMLSCKTSYSFYFQDLEKYVQKFFLYLFSFLRCHRKGLLYIFLILHIVVISGMFRIKVIGYVFDDLNKSCSVSRDIAQASKLHKGLVPINIFFTAKDDGIIFQPEKLKIIEKLEEFIKKEPDITNAISVVTYLKEIAYKLEGVKILPEEEFRIRNYINAYLCDNSKFALELLSEDFSSGQIKCRIRDMGSEKFEGFLKRLKKNTEIQNNQLQISVTGLSTVVQEVYRFLVWGILKSTFATILVITIIFIIVFRKFRDVIMAVLINLFPLLYGAGLMGWFGIRVNISVIVIFSIAFGLVVDDTIHLLYRFVTMKKEKHKLQPSTLVLKTLLYSGRGVLYTSFVIIFGFLIMFFSVFSLQYYMGSLLAMIVFVALLFDMIYLPAMLLKNKNLSKI